MARLSGGELGGREIRIPGRNVRPTQERVRAAVFNSLASRVPGCRFLDLFAGSGGVGLDAWSRGAGLVCWVESDPAAFAVLRQNVAGLCRKDDSPCSENREAKPVRADVRAFLERHAPGTPYDIIYLDPPYDTDPAVLEKTLRLVVERSMLAADGLVVLEERANRPPALYQGLAETRTRDYGDTRVRFLAPE